MTPLEIQLRDRTRRHFLRDCRIGLGSMAMASLGGNLFGKPSLPESAKTRGPHRPPRARHVIYLHMAGSPSQLDLFDHKPELIKHNGEKCPKEYIEGQQFAFIKGHPVLLGSPHKFAQHGQGGAWVSELMPHLAGKVDELTIVKSLYTDQFNHAPAQLYLHTGSPRLGSASLGSWCSYGLGSENENLPGFVVLVSGIKGPSAGKSVWGSGFLPGRHQGVQCRSKGEPVLFVNNPDGITRERQRRSLDALRDLNELQHQSIGDPETLTRIEQYELAYRMQISVPEVMDISRESQKTIETYGAAPGEASFANNCLLARRLVEQGVRFVQLYDWGWDSHGGHKKEDLLHQLPKKCGQVDRPVAALLNDLKQRGLLDETLVIWGGEFGRTCMRQAHKGKDLLGRDHHPHAFTMLMAGGGMKEGLVHGETDQFGYFIKEGKIPVQDLQATILHQLGLDPLKLSPRVQGLDQRLVGPAGDAVVRGELLA